MMKFISVQRTTRREKRFTPNMGIMTANVVYVKKAFLQIPYKVVHKYRETYYGKVKDCDDCKLTA